MKVVCVISSEKQYFDQWVQENKVPNEEYIFINKPEELRGREFSRIEYSFSWNENPEVGKIIEIARMRVRKKDDYFFKANKNKLYKSLSYISDINSCHIDDVDISDVIKLTEEEFEFVKKEYCKEEQIEENEIKNDKFILDLMFENIECIRCRMCGANDHCDDCIYS